jgi:AraC-like DNA-binding protein
MEEVLSAHTILHRDGIGLTDVVCRHGPGRGLDERHSSFHAIVFVRRGCFVRAVDGVESVLDPTTAYCASPGDEQRIDHPHAHGDDCTALFVEPELLAQLWGGDPELPTGALPTSPRIDLEHRLLLTATTRGSDAHELVERTIALAAAALAQVDPSRVASGRPATTRARRVAVDGAREALAADPDRPLPALARELAISPHHLSRVFRSATGHTIARHRMRLRARRALDRLAGGERDLARIAADVGFADQSHLHRVLRGETGRTPAELRHELGRRGRDSNPRWSVNPILA